MRLLIPAFFLCVVLPAAAQATEMSVVGDWYEDTVYGGERTIAVGHFKSDGSFSVDFRRCLKQGELQHTDTGHWVYANGKLRMTTEASNGFWIFDIEDYETISNDGRIWVYKSVAGPGFRQYGPVQFRDIRVTPDSKAPSCDLTS
jgi:hypothetical protein